MSERSEVLTAERFAQGMTYDEWKASMTKNQELYAYWEEHATVPAEDVAFFKEASAKLGGPLKMLAIGEDWCGDVVREMPTVGLLAKEAGLDLRVFLRDQSPQTKELMSLYLNNGQFESIPVVAFFTHDMRELGHFIERAKATSAAQGKLREEILSGAGPAAADVKPGTPEYMQLMGGVREKMKSLFVDSLYRETLREFRDCVAPAL